MSAKEILMAAAGAALPLPVFVSSSISRTTVATNTVTAPTGIQDGDLLVAIGFLVVIEETITPPTGFNVQQLNSGSSLAADRPTTFIATKIASSESGNYTFTWSGSNRASAIAILVYRNATRVNTVGAITRANSTTATAASITSTYAGTLCAAFGINAGTALVTAPSGLTQRAFQNANDPSVAVYDLANQTATATSAYTLVWNAPALNAGFQFFVTNEPTVAPEFVASASTQNPSAGTTLVINKPTGTVDGDLMVAVMAADGSTSWSGDTGWTEAADQGTNPSIRIAYKIAASEGASYTFTASTSRTLSGSILTYRFAAYGTIGTFATGNNPLILPLISPSESQSILIAAGARGSSNITLGTPISMTAKVTDSDATAPSYIVCDQTVAKGPTGARYMTTGSATNVAGIMLAIKPTRSL